MFLCLAVVGVMFVVRACGGGGIPLVSLSCGSCVILVSLFCGCGSLGFLCLAVVVFVFLSVLWFGWALLFLCLAVVVFVFLPVLWWGWISLVSLSCGCDGLGGSLCLVVWGRLPSPSPCVLSGRGRGQMFLLLAAVLAKTEKLIFCCDVSHVSGLGESAPPNYPEEKGNIAIVMSVVCCLCHVVGVDLSCFSVLRLWSSV